MAIPKYGLIITAFLLALAILETGNFSRQVLPEPIEEEEYFLPNTREKRSAQTGQWNYIVEVVLNVSNVQTFELIRSALNASRLPIRLDNSTEISDVSITTVCSPTEVGVQCRCEEQFAWPYSSCVTNGCDDIIGGICSCTNVIPADGQFCQLISELLTPVEYVVDVELNVTDIATVDFLRNVLGNGDFTLTLGPTVNLTHINITTVCNSNGTHFQCRCEDQYVWSASNCLTYGACDRIFGGTCGCINSIPTNGQYCEPRTAPPALYEYIISVEVNITHSELLGLLRTTLRNINYPITINNNIKITDINISTVCHSNNGSYQCRCEDQYRWPCNQCLTHGSCDNITDNTCGCINAVPPDGQYCQPANQHNFTACPLTTTSPPSSTTPPVLYEYIISVELNTTDVILIDILRNTLRNINYPITINNNIQINDVNISTVCIPNNGGHQCRCEDQYRWPCNQCLTHGSCDNITDNTCGCINALAPDGQYCQPANQHNFTACPLTTTSPPTTNSTTVTTTGGNTTLTSTTVTNSTTDPNTTTVTTPPTTIVTNSTSNVTTPTATPTPNVTNTTTVTTPPTTIVTNSTPNVTTPTATPTPNVTTTGVTSPNNTGNSTSGVTSAPTPITTLTAVTSTTTTTISTTTISTTATSTLSTATTPTTTTMLPSTTAPGFNVEMFVELDQTFTEDLNNASSVKYEELESRIKPVLNEEYKKITGFMSVSVTGFRNGSIITDFVVRTTKVNPVEVAQANENIPGLIVDIAPVIGGVTAFYNSPDQMIISSNIIYTGNTMTLICGPPDNLDVGNFSASEWKFKGRNITSKRIKVTNSAVNSMLKVNNVILLDIGRYECGLTGGVITFTQKRDVKDQIRAAPIIRLQEQVNIKCSETEGQSKSLKCCVQFPYTVKWFNGSKELPITDPTNDGCITYVYQLRSCSESQPIIFTCKVNNLDFRKETAITLFNDDIICDDDTYGAGRKGDISRIGCDIGLEGSKTAECQIISGSGEWTFLRDTCIVTEIKELLISSEDLVKEEVSDFVGNLSVTVKANATSITKSSETISAIVDILNNIAAVSTAEVTESVMMDILETVDVIIGDDARESWALLNANETRNTSSELLGALESLANGLVGEFSFTTQWILLNRTTFNDSFKADLNNSIVIYIPDTDLVNVFITTITFSTLHNVMPVRNSNSDASNNTSNNTAIDNAINAAVVLVQISETIDSVTLSYDKLNESLTLNPQCVFWNFALFDNLGAWDDEGCTFVSDINNTVTCSCNHLTSFSILMATDIPQDLREALDIITYVGVGISLASLVICLIIEGYVWKAITRNSTAFMRHVSIINTALSLLIADICFIIAASIAKNPLENPGEDHQVEVGPCSTATFFMHFFYLALFFWMLVSGLLLFYRTVMVFSHMSKSIMLAIGFLLGYGCPLIIAVITVAVTAPDKGYIRKDNACWLNWFETKALLALVIPALTIVFINLLIVVVVLFKMLRRGVGDAAQTDERHTVMVLIRCVVILTPLFGLTWSLGVGTMISSTNKGLHIAFAFFNSLQGFFILVFGTLFDSKIRSLLSRNLPTSSTGSNNQTRSTSGGISSLSGLNWINRLRGRRYVYRVSEAANSSSNGASESFMNI